MDNEVAESRSLDELIVHKLPYPIAIRYQQLLESPDWHTKVNLALWVFEFGLRTLALGVISQYLIRDGDKLSDPKLNELLLRKFP